MNTTSPPRWTDVTIPGERPVRARLHSPAGTRSADRGGWLVWAHGGSWQRGSAAEWHPVTQRLAALSGWRVLSVDYRLAPAHRHPAALEDVLTALDWARGRAGAESVPVAVGGDSAGGTLAAAAALAACDHRAAGPQRAPLAAQFLAYPPLDPACSGASHRRDPAAFPHPADLRRAWRALRGTASPAPEAGGRVLYSTPLDAPDLRGLPPAVLAVGGLDPVADDVLGYAARLRAAAVPVDLVHLPDTAHADLLHPGSKLLTALAERLRTVTVTVTVSAGPARTLNPKESLR
ncbi:alpha/beta hydrolase [Streptomyces sp. NBC_00876]|uniref:alpha/beta hydrolase fold domain-containing protein n=1 Tax=Streptomyces sp. NBC_00876 TaxID=2975853 RepID=UPI00386BED70|nr:alpha/beta hydrolase [Streptomyces sp. NBC_00876]